MSELDTYYQRVLNEQKRTLHYQVKEKLKSYTADLQGIVPATKREELLLKRINSIVNVIDSVLGEN